MELKELIGPVVLSGVGLATAALEWPILREGLRSMRWPSVRGRVTSSEFKDGPFSGRYIRTTTGRALVTYQYEVNGHEVTGTRVFVGDQDFGSAYEAQRRTRHYYPGVSVAVYYDPREPSQSVLERGVPWARRWKFFMGVALLVAGVAVIISS